MSDEHLEFVLPLSYPPKMLYVSITALGDDKQSTIGDTITMATIWERLRDRFKQYVDPEKVLTQKAGENAAAILTFIQMLITTLDTIDGTIDGKITINSAFKRELVVRLTEALLKRFGITGVGSSIIRALVEKYVLNAKFVSDTSAQVEAGGMAGTTAEGRTLGRTVDGVFMPYGDDERGPNTRTSPDKPPRMSGHEVG
jgi:hypothetical protein